MQKNKLPIGVFDSGLGGLTVAKAIIEMLPNEDIIYFGDTAHVPYGTKSATQITSFVKDDVEFLNRYNVKAVVIACNTADSVAKKVIEKEYDFPIYGVIDPASKQAATTTKNNKIGVIATNATVNSNAYKPAIEKYNPKASVYQVACPLLVPLVENGRYRKGDGVIETVLKEYLEPLKQEGIDTLILGCTHYPLLADIISQIIPEVTLISSSEAAAKNLAECLLEVGLCNDEKQNNNQFFVSDNPINFQKQAELFMGKSLDTDIQLAK